MGKKYIFFDIDGTLTSHTRKNYIHKSTLHAIEKLKKQGHFVSLATGRSIFFAKELADKVHIHNLVCEGGNGIIIDGKLHSYEPLDQTKAISVIDKCEQFGLSWAVSNEDKPTAYTTNEHFAKKIKQAPFLTEVICDKTYDYRNEKSIRRILIENNRDIIDSIDEIKEIGLMVYGKSIFGLVEPDDKYKGISKLVKLLGGSEEDVIVFGDGLNDVKMFEKAAFSVAMGNADEKLKSLASYITDDADSDGIYNACIHLKLIE